MHTLTIDDRYTQLVLNTEKNFERVRLLRAMAQFGAAAASESFFHDNLSDEKIWDELTREKRTESELQVHARNKAAKDIGDAQAVVDAASIVLSHSILEEVVAECLYISAAAAPEEWSREIENRTVLLSETRFKTYDEHHASLLQRYIDQDLLRKKSLESRIGILLGKVPSWKKGFVMWPIGYSYDEGRIRTIDRLRQDIVHKVQIPQRDSTREDVEFLKGTAVLLCNAVRNQYGLILDVREENLPT